MSVSISSNTQKIVYDKEYRCPKCSIIPFINIFTNENKLFISTKCANNYNYLKPFDEMQIMSKTNPISNNLCVLCENENNKQPSNVFYYVQHVINFIVLNMEKHIN